MTNYKIRVEIDYTINYPSGKKYNTKEVKVYAKPQNVIDLKDAENKAISDLLWVRSTRDILINKVTSDYISNSHPDYGY